MEADLPFSLSTWPRSLSPSHGRELSLHLGPASTWRLTLRAQVSTEHLAGPRCAGFYPAPLRPALPRIWGAPPSPLSTPPPNPRPAPARPGAELERELDGNGVPGPTWSQAGAKPQSPRWGTPQPQVRFRRGFRGLRIWRWEEGDGEEGAGGSSSGRVCPSAAAFFCGKGNSA